MSAWETRCFIVTKTFLSLNKKHSILAKHGKSKNLEITDIHDNVPSKDLEMKVTGFLSTMCQVTTAKTATDCEKIPAIIYSFFSQ